MSRKEKLIKRLLSHPKDFSWDELLSLLGVLGFEEIAPGKTGGSRRRFIYKNRVVLTLHKPHPQNVLKRYQVDQVIELLQGENLL